MMKIRDWLVTAAVAVLVAALLATPAFDRLDGLGIDSLFWLREHSFASDPSANASPTVVIAIDEETYRQRPFKDTPYALWTPLLADLLTGLLKAQAKIVGFDVIFPTSAESLIPGYDRSFLVAQRVASQQGKIVLSRFQHSRKATTPFPGYGFAVGGGANIRASNLISDVDDVIRRFPLVLVGTDNSGQEILENGFALEIAKRFRNESVFVGAGEVKIGEWSIPVDQHYGALVNFRGGQPIPTYSLADIAACIKTNDEQFMRDHFKGKVVLLGAVLDIEDRKLTSRRFIVGPEEPYDTPRCALPPLPGMHDEGLFRRSTPGIYVHAQAINDLINRQTPLVVGKFGGAALVAAFAVFAAISAWFRPTVALAIFASVSLLWAILGTAAFQLGMVLPLFDPPLGGAVTYSFFTVYRFRLIDRDQRHLRRSFSYYLPAAIIDRMISSKTLPSLGGEEREITIWFSDLANFTGFSEGKPPQTVVARLNEYFTVVADAIEGHGGFIDNFIGDGVVAIFGAPLSLETHASDAISAAMQLLSELERVLPHHSLATRIGIHTGKAVVGNIGSARRFNYTAIGDTVNLAARLERANKLLGTAILVSEETKASARDRFELLKVARIRVKGRVEPVTVYTPAPHNLSSKDREIFDSAHTLIFERKFRLAADILSNMANRDPVAAALRDRVLSLELSPPPHDWDGTV